MNEKLELEFVGNNAQQYELETSVIRLQPESESIDITPAKESQTYQGLYDTVNVEGDENLVASNIKKGISIFEVEGTYEAGKVVLPDLISFAASKMSELPDWLENADSSALTSAESMFSSCINLLSIDISKWDTSNVTNANSMFSNCNQATYIKLNDTSKVTDMTGMFSNCRALTYLPDINTENVTTMPSFVNAFSSLQDIPEFDTKKVINFYYAFGSCPNLSTESLNNILAMLTKSSVFSSSNKTLKNAGLSQSQAEICTTLSNYQTFINAGWTTGY